MRVPEVYKKPPSHPSGWRGQWVGCGDARQAASPVLSAAAGQGGACRRCMRVRRRHGGWQSVRLVRSLTAASGTVAPSRPRPNRPAQNFEVPHTDQSAVVVVCADLGGFFALIVVDLGCADHRDRSTRRQGISGMILFVHASIRLYHGRVCC